MKYDSSNNINSTTFHVEVYGYEVVVDITAPQWIDIPPNISVDNTTNIVTDFNATDETAIDTYFLNSTAYFNINSSGWFWNISYVPVGNYTLNVSVNDTSNNINSTIFWVEVYGLVDTDPLLYQYFPTEKHIFLYYHHLILLS
ncbi:unnamed protein product [marine sediment metagenome]|uniref:Bacterial Ig-like domain-containing protein n=1 Tax=marine sediment metagenome TaxID=412755 RepID=X1F6W7_9ZZZZ